MTIESNSNIFISVFGSLLCRQRVLEGLEAPVLFISECFDNEEDKEGSDQSTNLKIRSSVMSASSRLTCCREK